MRAKNLLLAVALGISLLVHGLAFGQSREELLQQVGDPDSFGHNAKFLGLVQSGFVILLPSCGARSWAPTTSLASLGARSRCASTCAGRHDM